MLNRFDYPHGYKNLPGLQEHASCKTLKCGEASGCQETKWGSKEPNKFSIWIKSISFPNKNLVGATRLFQTGNNRWTMYGLANPNVAPTLPPNAISNTSALWCVLTRNRNF